MAIPPAYISHALPPSAKFGHHDKSFGTLPSFKDFHEILQAQGGLDKLIQMDLHEAIILLSEQREGELVIKVPTLGFTDPAFDYDLRPWFATPVSLNGFGAKADAPMASKPKAMVGVDFMGNEYPLLFNQEGMIDYDAIAKETSSKLYTTLKAIYFIYSSEQILNGEDLTLLPMAPYHQGAILLRPPEHASKPYQIEYEVRIKGEVVYEQSQEVVHELSDSYHVDAFHLDAHPLDKGTKLDIQINASAYQTGLPAQMALSLDLPAGLMSESSTEQVKLTQYYGMSTHLFNQVIEAILPMETLSKSFQGGESFTFNDFKPPEVMSRFYDVIKEGIENNSIPIMALSDYFADNAHVKSHFQQMDIEQMTKADHEAFSNLIQSVYQEEDMVYDLADKVDQILSVDKYYPQAHFSLLTDEDFDLAALELEMHISPIGAQVHQTQSYTINQDGIFLKGLENHQGLIDTQTFEDPFFSEEGLSQAASEQGHRFEISANAVIQGAQVIEGFDWENKDVIDLNGLFENLGLSNDQASVEVSMHEGNMEVWVHAEDAFGMQEKYHVATVVGQGQDGPLPDITDFIEFPS